MADVTMTFRLFRHLYPLVINKGMGPAYDRERRLLPWLLDAEVRGVPVDRNKLEKWNALFLRGIPIVEDQLRKRLGAAGLNFDEDRAVAEAIDAAGLVEEWELTESGQRATNKRAMERQCKDKEFLRLLSLRNTASTMFNSFVMPWLSASEQDGRLHTQWNQTRSIDNTGTKTGRIGSERPNLANVPNVSATHPELPNLRTAFLPEEGHQWGKADFSQQEFRIAAHFENGAIMQAYQQNAEIDFHALTANLLKTHTGLNLPRKQIKNVNFCLLYGGGVPRLADVLGCTLAEAEDVRRAYYSALPGMRQLSNLTQTESANRGGIATIGGRFMPVEPPKQNGSDMRTFFYKQLNKRVQGSAADMTKEAIVKFGEAGWPGCSSPSTTRSTSPCRSINGGASCGCWMNAWSMRCRSTCDAYRPVGGDSWGELEDFKHELPVLEQG
jgi:DNA polymerase-1